MRAIILAAGVGSRLLPLTQEIPKCMVPVGGKPIIQSSIDGLVANGITDIVIVLGYKKEIIKKFLQKTYGKKLHFNFIENDNYEQANNIYSLWLAKDVCNDDLILMESDIVFEDEILSRLVQSKSKNVVVAGDSNTFFTGTLVCADRKNIVTRLLSGENQTSAQEGEKLYKTVNIYKFSKDFFVNCFLPCLQARIESNALSLFYEVALGDAVQKSSMKLEILHTGQSKWCEIDTFSDLQRASYIFSSPKEQVEIIEQSFGGGWNYPGYIDFAYMKNQFFPPKALLSEVKYAVESLVTHYSSNQKTINRKAAILELLDERFIYVFNGSSQGIQFLSTLLGKVSVATPTFQEYINAFEPGSVKCHPLPLPTFNCDPDSFARQALQASSDSLIFINPNNPTSLFIDKGVFIEFLEKYADQFRYVVIDESFIDFVSDQLSLNDQVEKFRNLIILKSMGKSYNIAGLRLGYIYSSDATIREKYLRYIPIWNINSIGEFFLETAVKYRLEYEDSLTQMKVVRDELEKGLYQISYLNLLKPGGNFLMVEVQKGFSLSATELKEYLYLHHSILVKDLTSKISLTYPEYEGNGFLRIGVMKKEENDYLVACLKNVTLKTDLEI